MPGVMIYVQHLLGIGHLMRARLLAEALAERGFDVHLVSGGMPIGGRLPRGVRNVQLPPIRVSDASFTPLRDGDFRPIDDAYRARRTALLLAAFDAARPSAVLFETFPFGRRSLRFELFPLLERIDASRPRPLVIASIRDILQLQQKPEREREMLAWAARWVDAIFVHGDRRFARFEDTFSFADELTPPVHYTGFVLGDAIDAHTAQDAKRCEVVVSAGGGGVGIELLATALAAQPHSRFAHLTWRVLAGPNIPEAGLERLRRLAAPTAIVERSRVDFAALLRRAFISISQAGYNTTLDVVTSGARPVIVPFTGNGETEQRARGERLRDFGLAVVVDDRTLSPEGLAKAVDAAGTRAAFNRWDFDSDGASRTAALVSGMLHQHGDQGVRVVENTVAPIIFNDSDPLIRALTAIEGWALLDGELDAWEASGRSATLWWRDDDACRDSPALRRLLGAASEHRVPVTIAAIPASVDATLVDALAGCGEATIVQHGYAHRNHAPEGERSGEFGSDRPLRVRIDELERGRDLLARAFGDRFTAMLVPPWNRIGDDLPAHLPAAGFHTLSRFGPRARTSPPGLLQVNTHVDAIAWRRDRTFIGAAATLARLTAHLRARRVEEVDADEPTGLLTHHLAFGDIGWQFLGELFARTCRHRAVAWLAAQRVIEPPAPSATCSRSA